MQDRATRHEIAQESAALADELDLQIVNCLQLQPRASWTLGGEALDVDPVTVARRWQRLSSAGIAWVSGRATGQGGPESCLAVVELSCSAAQTPRSRPHSLPGSTASASCSPTRRCTTSSSSWSIGRS